MRETTETIEKSKELMVEHPPSLYLFRDHSGEPYPFHDFTRDTQQSVNHHLALYNTGAIESLATLRSTKDQTKGLLYKHPYTGHAKAWCDKQATLDNSRNKKEKVIVEIDLEAGSFTTKKCIDYQDVGYTEEDCDKMYRQDLQNKRANLVNSDCRLTQEMLSLTETSSQELLTQCKTLYQAVHNSRILLELLLLGKHTYTQKWKILAFLKCHEQMIAAIRNPSSSHESFEIAYNKHLTCESTDSVPDEEERPYKKLHQIVQETVEDIAKAENESNTTLIQFADELLQLSHQSIGTAKSPLEEKKLYITKAKSNNLEEINRHKTLVFPSDRIVTLLRRDELLMILHAWAVAPLHEEMVEKKPAAYASYKNGDRGYSELLQILGYNGSQQFEFAQLFARIMDNTGVSLYDTAYLDILRVLREHGSFSPANLSFISFHQKPIAFLQRRGCYYDIVSLYEDHPYNPDRTLSSEEAETKETIRDYLHIGYPDKMLLKTDLENNESLAAKLGQLILSSLYKGPGKNDIAILMDHLKKEETPLLAKMASIIHQSIDLQDDSPDNRRLILNLIYILAFHGEELTQLIDTQQSIYDAHDTIARLLAQYQSDLARHPQLGKEDMMALSVLSDSSHGEILRTISKLEEFIHETNASYKKACRETEDSVYLFRARCATRHCQSILTAADIVLIESIIFNTNTRRFVYITNAKINPPTLESLAQAEKFKKNDDINSLGYALHQVILRTSLREDKKQQVDYFIQLRDTLIGLSSKKDFITSESKSLSGDNPIGATIAHINTLFSSPPHTKFVELLRSCASDMMAINCCPVHISKISRCQESELSSHSTMRSLRYLYSKVTASTEEMYVKTLATHGQHPDSPYHQLHEIYTQYPSIELWPIAVRHIIRTRANFAIQMVFFDALELIRAGDKLWPTWENVLRRPSQYNLDSHSTLKNYTSTMERIYNHAHTADNTQGPYDPRLHPIFAREQYKGYISRVTTKISSYLIAPVFNYLRKTIKLFDWRNNQEASEVLSMAINEWSSIPTAALQERSALKQSPMKAPNQPNSPPSIDYSALRPI